jgi:hypothetical protein
VAQARAGIRLETAAQMRNDVLHARPSADGLVRWLPDRSFTITIEWLDATITQLDAWCVEVLDLRPR